MSSIYRYLIATIVFTLLLVSGGFSVTFTQLTDNPGTDWMPSWSPDGTKIVYVSSPFVVNNPSNGTQDIMVVLSTGGKPIQITTFSGVDGYRPRYSPDGKMILYSSTRKSRNLGLWVEPSDGGIPTKIYDSYANDFFAYWSHDGSKIVFYSEQTKPASLWIISSDGRNPRRLNTGYEDYCPSWSPDGTKILVHSSQRSGNSNQDLWSISVSDNTATQITNTPWSEYMASYSPNGQWIVFGSDKGGKNGLWIMQTLGGEPILIDENAGYEVFPSWSPDGKKIVYAKPKGANSYDTDIWIADDLPIPSPIADSSDNQKVESGNGEEDKMQIVDSKSNTAVIVDSQITESLVKEEDKKGESKVSVKLQTVYSPIDQKASRHTKGDSIVITQSPTVLEQQNRKTENEKTVNIETLKAETGANSDKVSSGRTTDIQVPQEPTKTIFERTEAQRYYDLSLSYIKSGLYVKGLETLNQVAFLYPDSDVADDALYQLALLRERSGDGEINLGEANAEFIDSETVNKVNLNFRYAPNTTDGLIQGILSSLNDWIVMSKQKKMVIELAKIRAVNEYLLAIDFLNTAFERYPESDIDSQLETTYQRITTKLDNLTKPKKTEKSLKEQQLTKSNVNSEKGFMLLSSPLTRNSEIALFSFVAIVFSIVIIISLR